MVERIAYKQTDGRVLVVIPSLDALSRYPAADIAEKDVPSGLPYKVIDSTDIPSNWDLTEAWYDNVSASSSGVGGPSSVFRDNPMHPDYVPAS